MDGSRGYYKLNKIDREGQIPYDLRYMWNLKNKIILGTQVKAPMNSNGLTQEYFLKLIFIGI